MALATEALTSAPPLMSVSALYSFVKDQRAVVDLQLAAEVPLVFELRRASDQTFDVEHAEPGRLELTMHPGDLPFPVRP